MNRAKHLHDQGRALQEANKLDQARTAYQEALKSNDQPALNTLANLIVLEINADRLDNAQGWYEEGMKRLESLRPLTEQDSEAACVLINSGLQLQLQLQSFHVARHLGKQLIKLKSSSTACTNLAVSSRWSGQPHAAIRAQRMALNLKQRSNPTELLWHPAEDEAASQLRHIQLMNLATYQLTCNPIDPDSWQLLEARLGCSKETWNKRKPPWKSIWNGTGCEELLVWDEQGYGDCIQSLRWLPKAAQRCKLLRLRLRPELIRLVERRLDLPENCCVEVMRGGELPWQAGIPHIPVMALPLRLTEPFKSGKMGTPYLIRRKRQSKQKKLRIGLVWAAGCKNNPEARRAARLRDCPVEEVHRWLSETNIERRVNYVNLQRPDHPQSEAILRPTELSLSGDWFDTAEILDGLDGLISVDTAMAHLGGAMGLPTLILLNQPCDWRWGREGQNSIWYETCTLARCKTLNHWDSALESARLWIRSLIKQCASSW